MPRFKDFGVGKHMEVLGGGKFQKDFKTVPGLPVYPPLPMNCLQGYTLLQQTSHLLNNSFPEFYELF